MSQESERYKKALEEIARDAPFARIGLEEAQAGGNFDDAYYCGSEDEHFRLASIAKEALATPSSPSLPVERELERRAFQAGFEAFCTKHWDLDEAWANFATADQREGK